MCAASTETGADAAGDKLIELYRDYIGEPDRRTDVYLGFALFFAGLGMGVIGLVLFVIERGAIADEEFWLRQVAFALGALGLPVLLGSVVVLLPADRRAMYVAASGVAVTALAVVFFVAVYPNNWNHGQPDYSLQGVTVYAVGLVGVLAATGAALVSYHVERAQGGPTATVEEDTGPEVTAEQVERDIEEAMAGTDISWGGVAKVETERLRITPDSELDGASFDPSVAKTHRSESVDDAVSGLRSLQGGQAREARSTSDVDDQTAALRELREQQRQEAERDGDGLLHRLLGALIGR